MRLLLFFNWLVYNFCCYSSCFCMKMWVWVFRMFSCAQNDDNVNYYSCAGKSAPRRNKYRKTGESILWTQIFFCSLVRSSYFILYLSSKGKPGFWICFPVGCLKVDLILNKKNKLLFFGPGVLKVLVGKVGKILWLLLNHLVGKLFCVRQLDSGWWWESKGLSEKNGIFLFKKIKVAGLGRVKWTVRIIDKLKIET